MVFAACSGKNLLISVIFLFGSLTTNGCTYEFWIWLKWSWEQVSHVCFFCLRERGCTFFLEPDVLSLKCYTVNKIKFKKKLENAEVAMFGNTAHSLKINTIQQCHCLHDF